MENKKRNKIILGLACELLEKMNFEIEKAAVEDIPGEEEKGEVGQALVSIQVNNPAVLIGFKGKNLVAIQMILALMIKNKIGEWVRVLLDVNNYRNEQKDRLMTMALNLADKAVKTGKPVIMANMSSYERRICHLALSERKDVSSDSEGEGEERHIVIKSKA